MEKFRDLLEARKPKAPKNLPEGVVSADTYDAHYKYFDSVLLEQAKSDFDLYDYLKSDKDIKKLGGKAKLIEESAELEIMDTSWTRWDANLTTGVEINNIKGIDCSIYEVYVVGAEFTVEDGEASVDLGYGSQDLVIIDINGEETEPYEYRRSDVADLIEEELENINS